MIKRVINFIEAYFTSGLSLGNFIAVKKNRDSAGRVIIKNNIFNYSKGNIFLEQYKHIFIGGLYNFYPQGDKPLVILDCGANIGTATVYFKKQFPSAKILAFEPGKNECEKLKKNVAENNLQNVTVYNNAIWIHNDGISFADTSDMSSKINSSSTANMVPTSRLKDIIAAEESISFLKLDIEGAEIDVLNDCKEVLHKVDKMFVEYHSDPERPQQFNILLELLTSLGFRYYIKEDCEVTNTPYQHINPKWGYDLQLQVFAYKGSKN
jgi:FkbM family methyltransferase